MMCHWVGYLKIKPVDFDELFDRKVTIDEFEYNLNYNDKTEISVLSELTQ